jgi:hypothetical protein
MREVGDILHNSEDDIGLVSDAVERNWGDHHDHEVEDPIGTSEETVRTRTEVPTECKRIELPSGQCIGWCTNSQRHNFCRIQPCHSKPADGKERVEYEKEDRLSNASLLVVQKLQAVVGARKYGHGDGHSSGLDYNIR